MSQCTGAMAMTLRSLRFRRAVWHSMLPKQGSRKKVFKVLAALHLE